jgi:hypothetical protein
VEEKKGSVREEGGGAAWGRGFERATDRKVQNNTKKNK